MLKEYVSASELSSIFLFYSSENQLRDGFQNEITFTLSSVL